MADFAPSTMLEAVEKSVAAAPHLTDAHAGAVELAKALARKIDAWDTIVEWALEDASESQSRPKVPAHDNATPGTLLKCLEALQLIPQVDKAKPGPSSTASPAQQALNEMRKGLHAVS